MSSRKHAAAYIFVLVFTVMLCATLLCIKDTMHKQSQSEVQILKEQIDSLNAKIDELEYELLEYESKQVELDNCPICDTAVEIEMIGDTFRIECENCDLNTGYKCKSRAELVDKWNSIQ